MEGLIELFGKQDLVKMDYADLIDKDQLAKNDFFYFKKGYELGQAMKGLPAHEIIKRIYSPNSASKYVTRLSDNGIPLVYVGAECDSPVLTIENCCKWYSMYLVNPDGSVVKAESDDSGLDFTEWYDHVPNPAYVKWLAEKKGYWLDETSYEMIIGRYMREVKGKFYDIK